MSLREWYGDQEVLITGVTSELGRNLLEKLLRSFPHVRVHLVLRTREFMTQTDRVKKKMFNSPGFERLRQERPEAMDQVKCYEGNLVYDDLGLTPTNKSILIEKVTTAIHAGGKYACLLEFCKKLPKLKAVVVATDMYRCNSDQILESLMDDDSVPDKLPIGLIRFPKLAPAHREPMPGYVQLLKGPTAMMVGAGHVLGRPDLPAEIIPADIAVNTLICAAWDVDVNRRDTNRIEPTIYNANTIDCSWGDLVHKGNRASSKFRYPTFRLRGICSSVFLHWFIVFFFEWLPSFICDCVFYFLGRKKRILPEYHRIRDILKSFESVTLRCITVERCKINEILLVQNAHDQEIFPLRPELDLEAYILCAAAATRKYCVNEDNLRVVRFFLPTIIVLIIVASLAYFSIDFSEI